MGRKAGEKKNDDDYGDHYSLLEDIYTIIWEETKKVRLRINSNY